MKVDAAMCDGPACREIGEREAKNRPPYGWWTMRMDRQGTGPSLKGEFCSNECVSRYLFEKVSDGNPPEEME
jgi:hypothetical protein